MTQRTCTFPGCDKPHKALGYCRTHYSRIQRRGDVNFVKPRKPGRRITKFGYVQVRVPWGHPLETKTGWVYEHRLVILEAGIEIPPGHHVHHRNHIKADNRLENLVVLDVGDHVRLHHLIADALCPACGANDWYVNPTSGYRRCRECRRRTLTHGGAGNWSPKYGPDPCTVGMGG